MRPESQGVMMISRLMKIFLKGCAILLVLIVLIGVVYWIVGYKPYLKPIKPVVTITPRIEGRILGNDEIKSLHPCAGSTEEAKQLLNQYISFQICEEDWESDCEEDVNEFLTLEQIDRNFEVTDGNYFYRIDKSFSEFDDYLGGLFFIVGYSDQTRPVYVCSSDVMEYLNTAYQSSYEGWYATHPYELEDSAFEVWEVRKIRKGYLDNPELGIARIAEGIPFDTAFMEDFTNLLYEIGYYYLDGFNSEGFIVNREIVQSYKKWIVRDTIMVDASSDIMPIQRYRSEYVNIVTFDERTRVVTATIENPRR